MFFRRSSYLSVYFILDPSLCRGRDPAFIAAQAIDGGASILQLRDKSGDRAAMEKLVQKILPLARRAAVPLVINDDVMLALETGADGVHLGQDDMPVAQARALLGPDAIIGQTAFTIEQLRAIDPAIVDYAGSGPFFETKTEKGKPVLGARMFSRLAGVSPVPVVGVGGITPDNAAQVMEAGAAGVAVMRAISESSDPSAVTCKIGRAVRAVLLPDYLKEAS